MRTKRGRPVIFLITALLSLTMLAGPSCGSLTFSKEIRKKLIETIEEMKKESGVPGIIVGIRSPKEGELVLARGVADVEKGSSIRKTTVFRIGGITETFIATVVLQLVDEGKISLDDRVDKYLKGVPDGQNITIRELLNMTSGLEGHPSDVKRHYKTYKPEELLGIVFRTPRFPPGQDCSYSITNHLLLGLMIEKVTGNSLGSEVTRRTIERLGLKNTTFPEDNRIGGDYARGYLVHINGKPRVEDITDKFDFEATASLALGPMTSDLEDLMVWGKAIATGELISDKSHQESETWVEAQPDISYGLGFETWGDWIGYWGAATGYSSAVYYLPSRDMTIVVLSNEAIPADEAAQIFDQVARIIAPNTVPREGWPKT